MPSKSIHVDKTFVKTILFLLLFFTVTALVITSRFSKTEYFNITSKFKSLSIHVISRLLHSLFSSFPKVDGRSFKGLFPL